MAFRFQLFVLLTVLLTTNIASAQSPVASFVLRDHLRRQWQSELVFFPVATNVFGRTDLALVGPDETPVTYQWVDAEAAPSGRLSVAFLASMPELGEATYRLVKGRPHTATDIKARQSGETVTLETGRVGITLGGSRAAADGPIAGVRLASGRTVGRGVLTAPSPPTTIATKLVTAGPVFAEATVDYTFPDYHHWRLRFRVIAGEPVVLVDETFQLPAG